MNGIWIFAAIVMLANVAIWVRPFLRKRPIWLIPVSGVTILFWTLSVPWWVMILAAFAAAGFGMMDMGLGYEIRKGTGRVLRVEAGYFDDSVIPKLVVEFEGEEYTYELSGKHPWPGGGPILERYGGNSEGEAVERYLNEEYRWIYRVGMSLPVVVKAGRFSGAENVELVSVR